MEISRGVPGASPLISAARIVLPSLDAASVMGMNQQWLGLGLEQSKL